MKRKLVKQGAATMMISLPSKWIKENKLDKGDEVELEEEGKDLKISLNPKDQKKETEIKLTSSRESSVRTILTNIYRRGFSSVKVIFSSEETLKAIETTVSAQLLGFEIIKKDKTSCLIQNITEPSKEQFNNIFLKLLDNVDELIKLTKKALSGENFEEFKFTEEKIKQFDNFCRRIISIEELEKEDLLLLFHQELAHAQRNLYHLLVFLSKNKINSGKPEFTMLEDCKKMFDLLKEAYNLKKLEIIEEMHELETETYKKAYTILSKNSPNAIVIHGLVNASRGFYLASSPLIGFTL